MYLNVLQVDIQMCLGDYDICSPTLLTACVQTNTLGTCMVLKVDLLNTMLLTSLYYCFAGFMLSA
jgi:hypothetical protein